MFSENESIKEIDTDNLRLLLIPFYEAEVNYLVMENRDKRVKLAQTIFIEYLKLMNHYELLEKDQKDQLKTYIRQAEGEDQPGTDVRNQQNQTYGPSNFDHFANRNAKVEAFRKKKELEA